MKPITLTLAIAAVAAFTGCTRPSADRAGAPERPPENGAQYKDKEGVALTATMKKAIGLEVTDVEEGKVAPEFTVPLHVLRTDGGPAMAASGWLTTAQEAQVRPGMAVILQTAAGDLAGTVRSVDMAAYQVAGDFEVTVEAKQPLELGARVLGTFRGEAGDATVSIPRSALLKTAEGAFVYAINGERYLRTPVKVGAENRDRVEITDGLYSGDQIVSAGVMPLWLAELQVLRGGKACTCGQ